LVCLRRCVDGPMHLVLLLHHPRKRMSAISDPCAWGVVSVGLLPRFPRARMSCVFF
jgi:hypothetical protein